MSKLDEVYEEYFKARNKHMKEEQALKNIESKLQELLIDECVENIMDSYELETLRGGGLLQERGTVYEEIKADFEKLEEEDRKNRYCHNQDELREVMISNWKEKLK